MHLKKRRNIPESIIIALIIGGLTLIPQVERFLPNQQTLMLITALFLAFWHGRMAGVLSFLIMQAAYLTGKTALFNHTINIEEILINSTLGIILSYLGGSLNQFRLYQIEKILSRYRRMAYDRGKLKDISSAQQDIIRELEERVTRQRTSLNLLHQKIQEIDCLDTNMSISNLLDTIIHFTEASSLSIWVYDNQTNQLKLKMRKGPNEQQPERNKLDLKESIEGWVFRNNQLFSIRMAMDYEALNALNLQESIICCPIVLDSKTWGVLNIENLPFIKYSSYTENLVQIIINLAQPALKRALDFESLLIEEEENPLTGFPQFTQLYRVMEKYRYDDSGTANSSSLVILEFNDFRDLIEQYGLEEIKKLQAHVLKKLAERSRALPELFHYREDSMVALFIPSLDYDGCSLFCLESLDYINSNVWLVKGDQVQLEINLGYASCGISEKMDPDDLMKRAEYLLEIQKI